MDSADLAQFKSMVDDLAVVAIVVAVMLFGVALPVFLYYRGKGRATAARAVDQAGMQELWDTARRMEARIGYLETVLDTEVPGWRGRSGVR